MTADRRPAHPRRQPLIAPRDLVRVALVSFAALVAWTVPERHWDRVAGAVARLRGPFGRRLAARAAHVEALVGRRTIAGEARRCLRRYLAHLDLERLQLLRVYHPRGWNPRLRLEGAAHIDRALAGGRGAILWVANLSFHRLVTKMTLHGAGYRLTHLSNIGHSFSDTRFGIRVLNPVSTVAEGRYLEQRVIRQTKGETAALRELVRKLERNGIVSITAPAEAPQGMAVPFLDGVVCPSVGPAKLSAQTGAPILPVFTLREPDGGFVVEVEAPIAPPEDTRDATGLRRPLERFATLLEARALRYPYQFRWDDARLAPDAGKGRCQSKSA